MADVVFTACPAVHTVLTQRHEIDIKLLILTRKQTSVFMKMLNYSFEAVLC